MSIQCKCKEEDKHGTTTIACCNQCGLPTEKFWDNESAPPSSTSEVVGKQEEIEKYENAKDWLESKMEDIIQSIETDSEGLFNSSPIVKQCVELAVRYAKLPIPPPPSGQ